MRSFNRNVGVCLMLFCIFGGFSWLGQWWPSVNIVTKDQLGIVLAAAMMWSNRAEETRR